MPGWVSLQQLVLCACSLFTSCCQVCITVVCQQRKIILMVPAFGWWSTASLVAILLPLDTAIGITRLSHPTSIDWFNIEYSRHVGGPLYHSFCTLGIEGWGDDWCMVMAALVTSLPNTLHFTSLAGHDSSFSFLLVWQWILCAHKASLIGIILQW